MRLLVSISAELPPDCAAWLMPMSLNRHGGQLPAACCHSSLEAISRGCSSCRMCHGGLKQQSQRTSDLHDPKTSSTGSSEWMPNLQDVSDEATSRPLESLRASAPRFTAAVLSPHGAHAESLPHVHLPCNGSCMASMASSACISVDISLMSGMSYMLSA